MSKEQNMIMVIKALKKAGLSDNQARILGAEIGRENSFQDQYLWGYHIDDANKKKNIGMISWQKDRATGLEKRLAAAGLLKNGRIVKGQESLDVMAEYLVHEIRTNSKYERTLKTFLNNPDVSYDVGKEVLGNNYIKWAYTNPKYASGHKNRDDHYNLLGKIMGSTGDYTPPATPSYASSAESNTAPQTTFTPETILQGVSGFVAPVNAIQNKLFSQIADLGLDGGLESMYAEAAKAISSLRSNIENKSMLEPFNPLRTELESIFDTIEDE